MLTAALFWAGGILGAITGITWAYGHTDYARHAQQETGVTQGLGWPIPRTQTINDD